MNEKIERSAISDVVVRDQIIKGEWIRIGDEAMLIEQRFNPYTKRFENYLNEEKVEDAKVRRFEVSEEVVAALCAIGVFGVMIAAILNS